MLYQAIRRGSKLYRCDTNLSCSNEKYRKLLCCELDHTKWQNPKTLNTEEVEKVRNFVNVTWRARMQASNQQILCALQETLPCLNKLQGKNLLDVCLDNETRNLICRSFKTLAGCSGKNRNEATAASKILHIINPELFIPWDGAIIRGYGGYSRRLFYTDFLRRMQQLANYAISQVEKECCLSRECAIESLKCDGHTLAKTLDEYNYMKFTRNCDAVWKAEYESCSSPQDVR